MLARHGIEPAPEGARKTTWKEFLTHHWDLIVAADFFTIEAWARRGLQRFIVLFLMELSTRKVEIAGIAPSPNGLWMNQIGRNLTDVVDGILKGKRYLIHDRDPLFTAEFLQTLADSENYLLLIDEYSGFVSLGTGVDPALFCGWARSRQGTIHGHSQLFPSAGRDAG
jgi:hypothetical protein